MERSWQPSELKRAGVVAVAVKMAAKCTNKPRENCGGSNNLANGWF